MKYFALSLAALAALACTPALAQDGDSSRDHMMKCSTGPVRRNYGMAPWLVYSCDDQTTLVVVTAPGNAATPFYFMLTRQEGGYKLSGKGTGDRRVTDAAYKDLAALTRLDIEALLEQTQKQHTE